MTVIPGENAYGPIDHVVAAGRRLAESRMRDVCTIERPTAEADPLTGTAGLERVWGGKCRVSTFMPQESNPEAGGATYTVQRYMIALPVGSYDPQPGDVITITRASQDPFLHGKKFRIAGTHNVTDGVRYRLAVDELH